jgi:hypothetical protein
MSLGRLSGIAIALSVAIALILLNPTMDEYLLFVETELGKAIDQSGGGQLSREQTMVRSIFHSHSHELVTSVVLPHTIRRNWGLLSVYDTTVFDSRILVVGLAGWFIPLRGIDEAILRLGRLAF